MTEIEKLGRYEAFSPSKLAVRQALDVSFKYGVLSFPFTYNRMKLVDCSKRILNIIKGKLAEQYFIEYLKAKKLAANTLSNETPFYTTDFGDLSVKGKSVDLKNNFLRLRHDSKQLNENSIDKLPALIPNNRSQDQWHHFIQNKKSITVFTFMVWSCFIDAKEMKLLSLSLNDKQTSFLNALYAKYQGKRQTSSPFSTRAFWEKWKDLSNQELPELTLNFNSPIYVCSYAGPDDKDKFKYCPPRTFSKRSIVTRINNQVAPIGKLRPFSAFGN